MLGLREYPCSFRIILPEFCDMRAHCSRRTAYDAPRDRETLSARRRTAAVEIAPEET